MDIGNGSYNWPPAHTPFPILQGLQMVAVCGNDEGMQRELAARHKGEGKSLLIVSFT
jgi:hypothetical protein